MATLGDNDGVVGAIKGCKQICLLAFQGQHRTSRMRRCFTNRLLLPQSNLMSWTRVVKKKKHHLSEAPTCIAEFLHVTTRFPRPGHSNAKPQNLRARSAFFQDRLNCPTALFECTSSSAHVVYKGITLPPRDFPTICECEKMSKNNGNAMGKTERA